jgi:ABC-type phosphate transport system substrate-binding protein
LSGQYPLTRNLTLVIDLGQNAPAAKAAQELVHFALCRSGQLAAIRAGFFPAELPTLRAGLSLLERDKLR